MNKLLHLLPIITVAVISCTPKLDMALTDQIDESVKEKIISKDAGAAATFDKIAEMQDWFRNNPAARKSYGSITYQQVFDYEKKLQSIDYASLEKQFAEEHPEYETLKERALNKISKYNVVPADELIRIELVGKKNINSYGNEIPTFQFKITPLKGEVSDIWFRFCLNLKSELDKGFVENESANVHYAKAVKEETTFSTGTGMNSFLSIKLNQMLDVDYETIQKDYVLSYRIDDYKYDGVRFSKVPESIRNYLLGSPMKTKDELLDDVIKDEVDYGAALKSEYIRKATMNELYEFDKQVYDMYDFYRSAMVFMNLFK